MNNFLSHTDKEREEMLSEIGISSLENLFDDVHKGIRLHEELNLPDGLTEIELRRKVAGLSAKNKLCSKDVISFLGGGCYNKFIPACIPTIVSRSEFITAYTPYQPEISQGTLQAIYEYQTCISNLTGMDVSNAGVYDGAEATAEAILMAVRIKRKNKVLVAENLNPDYKRVIETYCRFNDVEIDYMPVKNGVVDYARLETIEDRDIYSAILIQTPNYFGGVEDVSKFSEIAKYFKSLLITVVDPSTLCVLKSPAEMGADIAVGDIQSLGLPMAFGGPHAGFMCCKKEYMRQMPGRIVGKSHDRNNKTAFCLTLQAREQHIRRDKATSNICSNQALMSLWATVYMSVMGAEGIKEASLISAQRARFLAQKLSEIEGVSVLFDNYYSEFVLKLKDFSVDEFLSRMLEKSIMAGIKLEDDFKSMKNCVLVSTTEMTTIDDIYSYLNAVKEIVLSCKESNSEGGR